MKKYFLIIAILSSCFSVLAQNFEGIWRGTLNVPGLELPIVFELKLLDQWTGTMQSPKQSTAKIPLSSVRVQEDSVYLEVKSIGLSYHGKLASDKKQINGTIKQGALEAPMRLEISNSADLKNSIGFKRSQQVKTPYSYDTLAVSFRNEIDQIDLAGTITYPRGKDKYPAVVLVSGSGPQDRNESLMGHEPFKILADFLTRNGIAVLRYDDRGVAESKGDFKTATSADFSKDAIAALNYLKTKPFVNPKRIGIIGHSEGGLIAFLLAGQKVPALKFMVSLAGPTIPMDSLLLLQSQAVMKSMGKSMTNTEIAVQRENYRIVMSDLPASQAMDSLMKNMQALPESQNPEFASGIATLLTPWYRYFLKIDPIPQIKKINIPVFAAFGGKDIQVPALANAESLTDNLPKGKLNAIKVYPELNHLFQKAKTGAVVEYSEIEETLNEELLNDIVMWIKSLK